MLPNSLMIPIPSTGNSVETPPHEKNDPEIKSIGEPKISVVDPGTNVVIHAGQPALVVRHLTGGKVITTNHPLMDVPVGSPLAGVRIPEKAVDLKPGHVLTEIYRVAWRQVPGKNGQLEPYCIPFSHQWPLPQSESSPIAVGTATAPSTQPTKKPSKREKTLQKLSVRLKEWGMDCPEDSWMLDCTKAYKFISGLDPSTRNYQYARHWVSVLPNLGAWVGSVDHFQRTALTSAIIATQFNTEMSEVNLARNLRLVKVLIKAGVPINLEDHKGKTALMYAIEFDLLDVATALCEAGADLSLEDSKRRNVWWYAAVHSEKIGMLDLLKKFTRTNAIINAQDGEGRTPLMHALDRVGKEDRPFDEGMYFIQKLLRYGSNPALGDKNRNTAWIQAAGSENGWLVEILGHFDNAGVAINIVNRQGESALSIVESRMHGANGDGVDEVADVLNGLYRFGAIPRDGKLARIYRELREIEARLISEFASIKNRLVGIHAIELARLETDCARPSFSSTYRPYGGRPGNEYFSFYTSHIAEPALGEFFMSASKVLKGRKIDKELFAPMFFQLLLDQAGQMRRHIHEIASASASDKTQPFGERIFAGRIVVDPVNSYAGWHKHVLGEIRNLMLKAWEACAIQSKSVTLKDVLAQMTKSEDYEFEKFETKESYRFKKSGTAAFSIRLPPELLEKQTLRRRDIRKMDDADIKCFHKSYDMDHPAARNAAGSLINAISLPKSAGLQRQLSRELFAFMKHIYRASYLERGMASVTEWVVAGICRRHGLVFDYPNWKTDGRRENIALDHEFLSDFDGSLGQRFVDSVSFKPAPTT